MVSNLTYAQLQIYRPLCGPGRKANAYRPAIHVALCAPFKRPFPSRVELLLRVGFQDNAVEKGLTVAGRSS